MHALYEPRGPALDGQIMSRSVAYAVLCLLVVAARGYGQLNRVERAQKHADYDAWSYDEATTGPSRWPGLFKQCDGKNQSPVDIDTDEVDHNEDLDEIDFDNYSNDLDGATMVNNGHTVVVEPGESDTPLTISDGGLDGTFKLTQIHFHWGADSKQGSEHTIDGTKYPMEMHLVHVNTKYKTQGEALKAKDGLAVLGVLFKVDDEDNEDLEDIVEKLDEVINEGERVELDDLDIHKLLPDDLMNYYRYEGSLTTPDCNEAVIWTVFDEFVPISEKQLKQFRSLKEKEPEEAAADPLVNNFRPVQPLNSRVIQVSFNSAPNIAFSACMSLLLATMVAALTFLL